MICDFLWWFVLWLSSLFLHFDEISSDFIRKWADHTGEDLLRKRVFNIDHFLEIALLNWGVKAFFHLIVWLLKNFLFHIWLFARCIVWTALGLNWAPHSLVLPTEASWALSDVRISVSPVARVSNASPRLPINFIIVQRFYIDVLHSIVSFRVIPNDWLESIGLNSL